MRSLMPGVSSSSVTGRDNNSSYGDVSGIFAPHLLQYSESPGRTAPQFAQTGDSSSSTPLNSSNLGLFRVYSLKSSRAGSVSAVTHDSSGGLTSPGKSA